MIGNGGTATLAGIVPHTDKRCFAFTAPMGLANPMTCTHVRLLGPCFKTGRRGHRPTRNRYAARAEALKETTPIPVAAEPEGRAPADKSTFHPTNLARKQRFVA